MAPGRTSIRLIRQSRMARPITAVARSLLPSALKLPLAPSSSRIGPFSTTSTAQPPVLAVAPCIKKSSCIIAVQAVRTTGKCLGRRHHRPLEAGLHRVGGRRHDGQAVGPAAAVIKLLDRGDVVCVVSPRRELHVVPPGTKHSAAAPYANLNLIDRIIAIDASMLARP